MKTIEKKIEKLQAKAVKFQQKMNNEIYGICEGLDYTNSSRFSYNIDKLKQFVEELNNFKIITK
jgi:hypothetical protein